MKHLYLIFMLLFAVSRHSFSQTVKATDSSSRVTDSLAKNRDSIVMTGTGMGGLHFYEHGQNLNLGSLSDLLRPNPEAYSYLQKAKTNNGFATFFAVVGGFCIGYSLGRSFGGTPINWGVLSTGIGATGLTIPFAIGTKRNAVKAVRTYNAGL